jgi:YD repeat-containing protein
MRRFCGILVVAGAAWLCAIFPARASVKDLEGIVVIGHYCGSGIDVFDGRGNLIGCASSVGGGADGSGVRNPPSGGGNVIANPGDTAPTKLDANPKSPCDKSGTPTQAGNPVVFSTGNKIQPVTDFVSAGEMALKLTRTYNHYWDGIGIFGRRWLSDYDYKLLFTTDNPTSPCYPRPGNTPCDPTGQPIWAQRPDGRKIKFNYASSPTPGWYEDKPTPIAKILKSGATYQLYSEDHTVEIYDGAGFPSSIKSQHGIGWTFQYDGSHYLTRVTHTSGRHVDFTWSDGLLAQVTDPAGNAYRYAYRTISVQSSMVTAAGSQAAVPVSPMLLPIRVLEDPPPLPQGPPPAQTMVALLTGATLPGSAPTTLTYYYENARFLTALTGIAINNVRYAWFNYDAGARAIETKHANGAERYQFAYTLDASNTITNVTITNPLGKQTSYAYNAKGDPTTVSGLPSTYCVAANKVTAYDSAGYPSGTIDFAGHVTTYNYAPTGQLLQQVAGDGTPEAQITDYVWDTANNRVTKVTVRGDRETSYTYDASHRLTAVAIKNLSPKVGASAGQTRTATYAYTAWSNGLLASRTEDGPLAGSGDATTTSYSQSGDLLSVKNAAGHTTSYGDYNALGLPGFVIGPNGDKRSFVYDARARVVDIQSYRNGGTQHTYYEYDGFGRLSRITQPDGQTHSYQYDVAGRLVSEHQPEAGGTFAQTVYTYNAMSLPTSVKKQRVFVEPMRGTVP